MIKKIICFFKEHDCDPDNTDCGYAFCNRCNSHEYYNENTFFLTVKNFKWQLRFWFGKIKFFIRGLFVSRCYYCKKYDRILWFKFKNNHDDCLPF